MADELTIQDIVNGLKRLRPAQLWSGLTTFVSILADAIYVGHSIPAPNTAAETGGAAKARAETAPGGPVPCYQASNWPAGTWLTWGHIDKNGEPFPQITGSVIFDSAVSFHAQTDQRTPDATKNEFRGILDKPLAPGVSFTAEGRDGTGYVSHSDGQVTADGCMISGHFGDTKGNRGTLYYLFKRDKYYVDR